MECRRLQREVDLLQRKIATVRRQAATAQPGSAAAAGEDAMAVAAAAGDVWGADDRAGVSGRSRGTKTAIQRDKALANLGLHVVEEFPRDVLVDVVQVSTADVKWLHQHCLHALAKICWRIFSCGHMHARQACPSLTAEAQCLLKVVCL